MFVNTWTPNLGLCHRKEINWITLLTFHVYNDCLQPRGNRLTKPVITATFPPPSKVLHQKWKKSIFFGALGLRYANSKIVNHISKPARNSAMISKFSSLYLWERGVWIFFVSILTTPWASRPYGQGFNSWKERSFLTFGAESFVFKVAMQKCKDQDI